MTEYLNSADVARLLAEPTAENRAVAAAKVSEQFKAGNLSAEERKIAEEIFFKLKKIYNHKVAFLNKRRIEIKDKLLRLFYDWKVQILIVCADDFEKPFQLHGIHQVINFDISQNPDEHNQRKSLLRGFNKNSMMVSFCDEADKSRLDEIEKEFDTSIERFYYNDIGVKESYSAKTDSSEFGFGRYAKDRHRY